MSRLFISHSSANNTVAIALCQWLASEGFNDVFLDLDPSRGLIAGYKWQEALRSAADRCEGVIFLLSPAWADSKWCLGEFILAKLLGKRIFGVIVEPIAIDQVPSEMTGELQVCDLVGDGPTRTFDVQAGPRMETVALLAAGLIRLRRGLGRAGIDARDFPWPPPGDPQRAPYRGLRALEAQDAPVYFGRDAQIVRALDVVRQRVASRVSGLVVILGASGSGKSSFLRAGLWPRLKRDDIAYLTLPVIRPEDAVISGGAGLAVALSGAFAALGEPIAPGRVKQRLAREQGLVGMIDELMALAADRLVHLAEGLVEPTLVLALDQAEELFNPEGSAEADTFLSFLAPLLAGAYGGRTWRTIVIATIRSDRYERLQAEARLSKIPRDLFDLSPISSSEFKGIIEGPARLVTENGHRLEIAGALTERLISDAQGADALPLLGFILERLFADYGMEGCITLADYEAIGGLQGSLQAAVERALAEPGRAPAIPLDEAALRTALREAFIPWLARINTETGAPMRRVARLSEIPVGSRCVIDRLVAARLLVADRRAGVDVIEVAHESLLRQWPTLTAWLNAAANDLQTIDGVDRSVSEWIRNGRDDAWLDHRLERLAAAKALISRPEFRERVGADGVSYLNACDRHERDEVEEKEEALRREAARLAEIASAQKRTARLQRNGRWTLSLFAAVLCLGLAFLLHQRGQLTEQRLAAEIGRANLFAGLARVERLESNWDAALRLAVEGARLGLGPSQPERTTQITRVELQTEIARSRWQLNYGHHADWVTTASFSPDGKRVVTASLDKTARVWSAATGIDDLVLRGHTGAVRFASFSPTGSRVVTASADRTARVWDAASGAPLLVLSGHDADVMSAVLSPDQRFVLTASFDRTARIFDAVSGQPVRVLSGHDDWLFSAFYSPDGTRIVTSSQDKTARVWDAGTGKELLVLRGHSGPLYLASYSPDGRYIVTASSDGTARLWDAATGAELLVFRGHRDYVNSALFSPDGRTIVTGSGDRTARIWDATTGREIAVFQGHADYLNDASFSPDGKQIITAAKDRTARIWPVSVPPPAMMFTGHGGDVTSANVDRNGTRLVTSSMDKTARLWDMRSGRSLHVFAGHDAPVRAAVFSPDGSRVATASQDRTARVWDAATGIQRLVLAGHENWVLSVAYSPDGSKIVTASWDTTVRLWDAKTGRALAVYQGHDAPVWTAAFSPDGSRILSASWDMTVRVWDVASSRSILVLSARSRLWNAAFSPDGSKIAGAGDDGLVRIWNSTTGIQEGIMRGHEGYVASVAYNTTGTRLVTTSADGTTRIWDATSGQEVGELTGDGDGPLSAGYTPAGSIVTASRDGAARLWTPSQTLVDTAELVHEACARKLGNLSVLRFDELKLAGYDENGPEIDVCAATLAAPDLVKGDAKAGASHLSAQ